MAVTLKDAVAAVRTTEGILHSYTTSKKDADNLAAQANKDAETLGIKARYVAEKV
jgi:hypothetical protein